MIAIPPEKDNRPWLGAASRSVHQNDRRNRRAWRKLIDRMRQYRAENDLHRLADAAERIALALEARHA